MDIFKQTYINTINTCINVSGELILKMKIFKHPPFFKFLKHELPIKRIWHFIWKKNGP